MSKIRKTIISIGLTIITMTSLTFTGFADQIVYEKIEDEIISSGATYKNILRFGQNGWLNLNVIYVDLKDDNIELDVLTSSKGVSAKESLSTMAKNKGNIVSAINGDFFYMLDPDSPLGTIIKDGKIISTPITVHDYATFFIDCDKKAFVDYWKHEHWKNGLYASTSSGKNIPIASINKYTDGYQYIMLIDRNWATHSPGYNASSMKDMVEVIVVDDVVVEIRQKQPAVEIPENGYILLAAKGDSPWAQSDLLLSSVAVGDQITINKNIRTDLENIKLAVGGGTILVKDGQVTSSTQNISGAHPRTAIGITKDRNRLIFVTIDGRHTSYKGVDGRQLAEILIELGSHEAIIMDGGGSTTMVKRNQGEFEPKVINHPSDGMERKIINGLAVVSTSPSDSLKGIKAELDDGKSFVGASRKIDVKAFDRNYNPLDVDYSKINFSLKSGEGFFNGMYFIPTKPGKVIIDVEYLGTVSEITLDVLEELSYMEINPKTVRLNHGQNMHFEIIGVDADGYRSKINANDIVWHDEQGLGNIKDGIYTAGNNDGITKLKANFSNKTAAANILIDPNGLYDDLFLDDSLADTTVKDRFNKPYEIEGEKLFIHSGIRPEYYTLLDKIVMNKISSLVNSYYELSLFTGNVDPELRNNITKEMVSVKSGHGFIERNDNIIIQLDNSKNGIRQTNFEQWPWLQNLIRTTSKKNIFIVMSKPIFGINGFTDKLEANLFMDTLTDLSKRGKQVFVFYEGQNISVDVINGVRYISTGVYDRDASRDPQEAFKYIEFNINDKEVTYQIRSLFE